MFKILVIFAKFVWENRGKSKKNPTINFPSMLLRTNIWKKSETLVCGFSVEVLFELQISIYHLFCVLNGITLKSAIFAIFCGKFASVGDFLHPICTIGYQKSWDSARFTPKVAVFNLQFLNNLGIKLLPYYSRVMLKSVEETIFELLCLSCRVWVEL